MVHQHFRLVEPFTVAENVVLGDHRGEGRAFRLRPSRDRAPRRASSRSATGSHVDPRARIWQLSLGEQQRVEILKALYREARILILDEPTAVLTPQEADVLFETLREMAADGRTVIFISHKLHEVKAVADRVTVLRGGRSLATVADGGGDAALARGADGRPRAAASAGEARGRTRRRGGARARGHLDARRPRRARPSAAPRSSCARARSSPSRASRATASASSPRRSPACARRRRARCGSAGSRCAAATRARRSRPASRTSPRTASAPASRRASASRRTSCSSPTAGGPRRAGRCCACARIREHAVELIRRYRIAAPGPAAPARLLSGGNLQKVVLAREFSGRAAACSSPRRRRAGSTSARSRPCTRTCAMRLRTASACS